MFLLQDTFSLSSEFHLESSAWCMVLGIYLLRFLTLGTKINKKYRNLSTLITEQVYMKTSEIHLYSIMFTYRNLVIPNSFISIVIGLLLAS